MGGGLMQLVAYGAQDIYLTGNPQITFFKVVYRRHTNFSMESIKQTFDGTADFGGTVVATISRNGDLLHRIYLEHEVHLATPSENIHQSINDHLHMGCDYGSHVMKDYAIEIGGQIIDKHYGHWHSVYHQLTEFNPTGGGKVSANDGPIRAHDTLYNRMSGNGFGFEAGRSLFPAYGSSGVSGEYRGWNATAHDTAGQWATLNGRFWIPLYFWFCKNPGLALPLIALQYHEVKVKINFEDIGQLMFVSPTSQGGSSNPESVYAPKMALNQEARIQNTNPQGVINGKKVFDLWCDYIYLDTDERRRFAQVSHEYLIEQLQFQNYDSMRIFDLYFNHPIKELIWTGVRFSARSDNIANMGGQAHTYNDHNLFARGIDDLDATDHVHEEHDNGPVTGSNWVLKLNGHDRFKKRDYRYFTRVQIWQHHTGYGGSNTEADSIAVYSFALKPEEHQPSGTCNFSRIDTTQLISDAETYLNVYAINYNVLRIMSGMGGLAYSN